MNRRHFLQHAGSLSALSMTSLAFGEALVDNGEKLSKDKKSAILIWLGGGPPTIDMWDLKPGTKEGGPHVPIDTTGDFQISEHFPLLAKQGKDFSLIRSMATREADHGRGTYYMHTGFQPSVTVQHPSIGSVIAKELQDTKKELEIPPFFSIGTQSIGGGFLGTAWNPFVVDSNGRVNNLGEDLNPARLKILSSLNDDFIKSGRGELPLDHKKLYDKVVKLNTSKQMDALKVDKESPEVATKYGTTAFGRSVLMARRLIQQGVSFVEVGFGGWDMHQMTHQALETKLPELDKVLSALILDLKRLDLWDTTAIIMMGEFGRTPRINQDVGRDHWAASWSAFVSGGLFQGGRVIGETSPDGREIKGISYSAEDLMATTISAMGINVKQTYTSKKGRPIKMANNGRIIEGLI